MESGFFEPEKPPGGRFSGAARNRAAQGPGHRDARPAHGMTGRQQRCCRWVCRMRGVRIQPESVDNHRDAVRVIFSNQVRHTVYAGSLWERDTTAFGRPDAV